jgi:hypothetical protein
MDLTPAQAEIREAVLKICARFGAPGWPKIATAASPRIPSGHG